VIPDRLHKNIIKSEVDFVQASSGISESKPKHFIKKKLNIVAQFTLSRIVIPDRLHRNIIKSGVDLVQASSGISESKPKHFIKTKLNIEH
ncbi:MAG: hypothetical protein SGI89_10210, partial [bacterium]|nr:hypothetical protein [bacterium]